MKKKLFTLLALLIALCSGAKAADIWKLQLNGDNKEIINGAVSEPLAFFSYNSAKHNFNTKFTGASYDGVSYTSGLKMEVDTNVSWTTEKKTNVTIVQSTWSDYTIKFDDAALDVNTSTAGTGCRIYTIPNVAAGDHSVTRGSGESGVFAITVEEVIETKVATPTYTIGNWDATTSKYSITLSCTTENATIKYSTDNKSSYSDYTTSLSLAPGQTLDAYAVKTGLDNSDNMTQLIVPAAIVTVAFANADGAIGEVPTAVTKTPGEKIVLPKNFTMYKEGYTMTGWSDGTDTYDIGSEYTISNAVTLTAVFTENQVSLANHYSVVDIIYDFRRENGAPIVQWQNTNNHVWVAQAIINGKTIDVPMIINTNPGKFNNASNTDCTQINNGTILNIPSEKGAIVEMECHGSFTISTTQIDGSTDYTGTGTTKISYEVTNTADNIDITIGNGSYYKYVKVTLPAPTLTAVSENTWDFTNDTTWPKADYTSLSVVNNLEIGAASDKKISFAKMLKFGGTGSTSSRYVKFKVAGNCAITVTGQSSSSDERTLNIAIGNSEPTGLITTQASKTATYYYTGGGETDVFLYSANSGFNITRIEVTSKATGTITASGYNTFSSNLPLDLSTIENGTAYVATSVTNGKVVMTKCVDKVPVGTGLFIAGTAGEQFTISTTADATTAPATNLFVGMPNGGKVDDADDGFNYVFGWTEVTNPGFYLVASDKPTLGAFKAYLHTTDKLSAPGTSRLAIAIEGEGDITGISEMNTMNTVDNGKVYNLSGQRVTAPAKGLFIMNGKKIVRK